MGFTQEIFKIFDKNSTICYKQVKNHFNTMKCLSYWFEKQQNDFEYMISRMVYEILAIINGIEEKSLLKKHNVRLLRCPGDSTEDLLDHVKPVAWKNPDLIVIHFGTNDTTSGKDTKENVQKEKAVDTMKVELPSTEIAISLCTIRKDRHGIGRKVESCNQILRDAASRNYTYVIDNGDESCLGMKRLHLNRKDTSFLANNFKNFIDDI